MIIRSNHQALHVVQEQPNPHRQEQIIDLIFDPALLKKDFGTAQLRFETERGVQERTVQLRKAFALHAKF